MPDSVRPHRRQPTRLCRPWDSPGKNTGVGCHFLLQCMKVKNESEVTQLCVQLFGTPWTAAYQTPPSMGFSRQEYWSGVPLPSPLHPDSPIQSWVLNKQILYYQQWLQSLLWEQSEKARGNGKRKLGLIFSQVFIFSFGSTGSINRAVQSKRIFLFSLGKQLKFF